MSEYFRNQPVVREFDNVLLTAAFAGNQTVIDCGGMPKISLDINYARGGGEGASRLRFQLEHSPDNGANWYALVIDDTTTISTIIAREWEILNTAKLNVLVDIAYKQLRLSLRETGVVTNFGRVTVDATLSGL